MAVGSAVFIALLVAALAVAAATPLPFGQVHLDASNGSVALSNGQVVDNPSGGCSANPTTLAITVSLNEEPDASAQFAMVTSQNRQFTGPVSLSGSQLQLDLEAKDSTGVSVLTLTGYGTSFSGTANVDIAPGTPGECRLTYSVALTLSGANVAGLTLGGATGTPPPASSATAQPSPAGAATPPVGTPEPAASTSPSPAPGLAVGAPVARPPIVPAPLATRSSGSGPPRALVGVLAVLAVASAAVAVVEVMRIRQASARRS